MKQETTTQDKLIDDAAEAFVTGNCLTLPWCAMDALEHLTPEDFAVPEHWEWIKACAELSKRIPAAEALFDPEHVEQAVNPAKDPGIRERWRRLADECGEHPSVYPEMKQRLRDASLTRRLYRSCQEFILGIDSRGVNLSFNHGATQSARAKISELQRLLDEGIHGEPWRKSVENWMETFNLRIERKNEPPIVSFGLPTLDRLIGKTQPGELILLAGEKKGGKTAFCYWLIRHTCALKKTPTLLISLEMTRTEIIDRCVSIASGVDSWRIQQGKVDKEHLGPLHKAIQEVMDMPLHTSDLDTQFQEQIEATIGAHVVRHGVKVAIIDYVQLAESSNPKSNRFEQVSQFSRMLKRCAKRHGIVIWAVSQLNSQGGTFYGAQLDADCSRKLSIRKKDEEGEDDGSRVIDVELNRFGPSFTVDVQFVKNVHTFREIIKDGNGNVPAPAREADGPAKKKYWMNDNP